MEAGPEEAPRADGEPRVLVQRTQVLLVAGETQEPEQAGSGPSPGPPAAAAAAAGQLVLLLCGAPALRARAERLRAVLRGVRERSRWAPAALVGVVVQPRPEEEAEARGRLEALLCDVFRGPAPRVELHTAVFCPGRPDGALRLLPAACPPQPDPGPGPAEAAGPAAENSVWVSRSTMFKVLGALSVVCAGYIGSQYVNIQT